MRHHSRSFVLICTTLCLALGFAACSTTVTETTTASGGGSNTSSTSSTTNTGTSSTNGSTPVSATATPTATCATLLPSATIANTTQLSMNYIVPLPTNTVTTAPTVTATGKVSFTVETIQGCAPNSDTNLTISGAKGNFPFTVAILYSPWTKSNTFPTTGQVQQSCGATPCFASTSNAAMPNYLELTQVTDHGGGVITFTLTIALSPTAPTCASGFSSGYYYTLPAATAPYNAIPLPPLTRTQSDDSAGHLGFDLCTTGNGGAVEAFMNQQLGVLGWTETNSTSGDWANGSNTLIVTNYSYDSTTNTTTWLMGYPNPGI
jgi:hypothetical protein